MLTNAGSDEGPKDKFFHMKDPVLSYRGAPIAGKGAGSEAVWTTPEV